jgi:hypothetical protein
VVAPRPQLLPESLLRSDEGVQGSVVQAATFVRAPPLRPAAAFGSAFRRAVSEPAQVLKHALRVVTHLPAQASLRLSLILQFICKLECGQDHIGLSRDVPIAQERADARVHKLCEILDVRLVRIAAHLIGLAGDEDFDRTFHRRITRDRFKIAA